MKRRERRYWMGLLTTLVVVYAGLCAFAWLVSDSMIFLPRYASREQPPGAFQVTLDDGSRLSAVFLRHPEARFTIWYFHGNAEALADLGPQMRELHEWGFSVFALEYPGYGVSDGRPTESSIYRSLGAGMKSLREEFKVRPDEIISFGRSLGGGPAVELARRERVAGLILESSFTSAYRVMTRWPVLIGDKFTNLKKLRQIQCPVLVVHGRDDRTIPFHHGETLFAEAAAVNKHRLWVNSAGHNDLRRWAGAAYRDSITKFVGTLQRKPAT